MNDDKQLALLEALKEAIYALNSYNIPWYAENPELIAMLEKLGIRYQGFRPD